MSELSIDISPWEGYTFNPLAWIPTDRVVEERLERPRVLRQNTNDQIESPLTAPELDIGGEEPFLRPSSRMAMRQFPNGESVDEDLHIRGVSIVPVSLTNEEEDIEDVIVFQRPVFAEENQELRSSRRDDTIGLLDEILELQNQQDDLMEQIEMLQRAHEELDEARNGLLRLMLRMDECPETRQEEEESDEDDEEDSESDSDYEEELNCDKKLIGLGFYSLDSNGNHIPYARNDYIDR
jgi:hypothetical protein